MLIWHLLTWQFLMWRGLRELLWRFAPVWVQIHGLPIDCWTAKVLSLIGSEIGRPLYTDRLTRTRERVSYARLLVEVDMMKDWIIRVPVNLPTGVQIELGVHLSWNGLQGEIPPSIGNLWWLQKLDLSYNKISGRIPAVVGRLERLVLLDLSHNSLAGPVPDELSGLRRVQYLLVESNPIGTTIPSFLGAIKSLVVLGLSDCGLSGHVPTFLGALSNLTSLSLDRNRLNGTIPSALEAIPNLDQLNLSQNMLSGGLSFSEEFVSRLGRRLDVRDNQGLCMNPPSHQISNLPFYLTYKLLRV